MTSFQLPQDIELEAKAAQTSVDLTMSRRTEQQQSMDEGNTAVATASQDVGVSEGSGVGREDGDAGSEGEVREEGEEGEVKGEGEGEEREVGEGEAECGSREGVIPDTTGEQQVTGEGGGEEGGGEGEGGGEEGGGKGEGVGGGRVEETQVEAASTDDGREQVYYIEV